MMILNKSKFVRVEWSAIRGRSHLHQEDPAVCLTCAGEPSYSVACAQADHRRRQVTHTTTTEAAPEEARRVQALYGLIQRRLRGLGFAAGSQVYLLDSEAPLDAARAEIQQAINEANAGFKACYVSINYMIFDINPDAAHEETLRSIQQAIEQAVEKVLEALRTATDAANLRKTLSEVRNLSQLLEKRSQGAAKVDELVRFTARAAGWLKDAADEGAEAVEKAQAEVRQGGRRFASILNELNAEQSSEEAA